MPNEVLTQGSFSEEAPRCATVECDTSDITIQLVCPNELCGAETAPMQLGNVWPRGVPLFCKQCGERLLLAPKAKVILSNPE